MNISTKIKYNFNGRKEYITQEVLDSAPTGGDKNIEFFKIGKYISDNDLEEEYESRGLIPATIEVILAYDKENQSKMDKYMSVATHWKYTEGNWCYATFCRWYDEREIDVDRGDGGWGDGWGGDGWGGDGWGDVWWFCGVKKKESVTKHSDLSNLELAIETVKKAGYQVSKII